MDQQKLPIKVQNNTILVKQLNSVPCVLQLQRAGFAASNDENTGDELLMRDPAFGLSQQWKVNG